MKFTGPHGSIARKALWVIAAWSLSAAVQAADPPTPAPPAPRDLGGDTWLIPGGFPEHRQPDGNSVIFAGPLGLVVLDTGRHAWQRQAILDFARKHNKPIIVIVNSHWHLDHVSGNPDLKAAYPGAKVYASNAINDALTGFLKQSAAGAREYLKSAKLPPETAEDIRGDLATIEDGDALKPDVVVEKSGPLSLAGRELNVNLSRNGPTAGDVWLYDPRTRIAATGDLVTLPVPFLDTACVAGWEAALEELWATPFKFLVPGHGNPMTRAEFGQYRTAFDNFAVCVKSDKEAAQCTAGWIKDAGPLLDANDMDKEGAREMAAYYVTQVLRPHDGNSIFCNAR